MNCSLLCLPPFADVILPGRDAVDYSDIKLTEDEEKMTVHIAPMKVTAKAAEDDDMDFDAPEAVSTAPVEISKSTVQQLMRNFNGITTLRYSELFLLAMENEKDAGGWLPQRASNQFSVPTLTLNEDVNETESFTLIPGRDKVEDSGLPEEADEQELALPVWDPNLIGFSLFVPKPQHTTLSDRFEMDSIQKTTQSHSPPSRRSATPSSSPQTPHGSLANGNAIDAMDVDQGPPSSPESTGYYSATTEPYGSAIDIDTLVHPVQNTAWELDIIWDAEDDEPLAQLSEARGTQDMDNDDGNLADISDSESIGSSATQETTRSGRAGFVNDEVGSNFGDRDDSPELSESVFRPTNALSLPSSAKLSTLSGEMARERQDSDMDSSLPPLIPAGSDTVLRSDLVIEASTKLRSSIFPAYNRRLDEGDWMDRVVWDDCDMGQVRRLAPLSSRVEVDMTDVHILLEEEGAHVEDEDQSGDSDAAENLSKKVIRKRHLQLKAKTTDLNRSKLDALHSVDKFNLSRDAYYLGGAQARSREKKSIKLTHSTYAQNNVLLRKSLSPQQYEQFHRPRLYMYCNVPYTIFSHNALNSGSKKRKNRGLDGMKHRHDLSAREGRIVLFEYSEEFPPALSDIGMASRIITYQRKEARIYSEDAPELAFLNTQEKEANNRNLVTDTMPIEDGELFYLDRSTDLPFLGDIQEGATMQAVHNNLFRAPIFRHLPESTDFLMLRSAITSEMPGLARARWQNVNEDQLHRHQWFYVREIPAIYLVGQQEPEQAIPAPNSRAENEYVRARLEQFSYHLFALSRAQGGRAELKLSAILASFPRTETAARKVLRRFALFGRIGEGTWSFDPSKERPTLPTEAEIKAMTTLDDACLFDCQQAVLVRLKNLGVWPVQIDSANIHRNVKTLHERHDPRFRVARFIAEELELAAWNLTSNFIVSVRSKSILQLTGLGDPSGCGQAYSYLRLPMKVLGLKKDKEKEATVHVKGTESDLRQLTLPELNALLREAGVSEEEIQSRKRWDQVKLLGQIADSRMKQEAEDSNLSKFARISKHSVATHQDQYNTRIQQIWSAQISALRYHDAVELAEDEHDLSSMLNLDMDDDDEGKAAMTPEETADKEETDAYLRFVNSLEVTKPGEASGDQSAAPTRPGSPSASGTTSVSRVLDDVITINPATGLPTRPGTYAKIISTNSSGFETVTWSQEPSKLALARESNGSKPTAKKAKATRAKRTAKPDAKPIKCSRCGQTGHNRNSSACPKYTDDDGGGRKKTASSKKKSKRKDESDEEEELVEDDWIEEEEDDGDETPEEDFADDVGIAANRQKPPVVMTEGTKLRFNVTANRRRSVSKRKRGEFVGLDEDDESEDYGFGDEAPVPRKKAAPKPRIKADSPQGELNTLLRGSLDAVYTLPLYEVFKARVDRTVVPDYYTVIKSPMYMDLIASRLRSYSYTSVDKYLADWDLLRINCHTYNRDTSPTLLPLADELYQTVCSTVASIGMDRLRLLEDAVRESNPGAGETPMSSAPATPAPNHASPARMPMDHYNGDLYID